MLSDVFNQPAPQTYTELLDRMAYDDDASIRALVALNPNTTPATLDYLGYTDPEMARHIVHHPAALPHTLLLLAERSHHAYIKGMVAAHPAVPPRRLTAFALSTDSFVRGGAASHPGASAQLLTRLGSDSSAYVRAQVAANPATPADVLERLAWDENPHTGEEAMDVREGVAINPATPPELLTRMLQAPAHARVHDYAARHPNLPMDVFKMLVLNNPDATIRAFGASNTGIDASILASFAKDPSDNVRRCLAENPNTPADVLAALAADKRMAPHVARHENAPAVILSILARSADYFAREAAASNLGLPVEDLSMLLRDAVHTVRGAAGRNPAQLIGELAKRVEIETDPYAKSMMMYNPSLPRGLMEKFAVHGGYYKRQLVANPALPISLRWDMMRKGDVDVRKSALAVNNPAPV